MPDREQIDEEIFSDAFDDVMEWLGFDDSRFYLRCLQDERHEIFKRASDVQS